jgi:hypothetical protein
MSDHVSICEACRDEGPLYLRRLDVDLVAALCLRCFHRGVDHAPIRAAQAAEMAKEHSQFRKAQRLARQGVTK